MLQIVIPAGEYFNEKTFEFIQIPETKLNLEHSLVSISKWESKWKKPFMGKDAKSWQEGVDYVRCMTLTQNVDPSVYLNITNSVMAKVNAYIEDKMTATWFGDQDKRPPSRRIVTSELIYAWMFQLGIPMECQKWHLNRLLTLIRVCDIEQNGEDGKKKMSHSDFMAQRRSLNAARKAKGRTHG